MKQFSTWNKLMGASAIALIAVAGCTGADQNGDGKTADSPAGAKLENAGDKMAAGAGQAADVAGDAASNAATSVGTAASNAGTVVAGAASNAIDSAKNLDDAAVITPKVKTALGANATLSGSKIDVDTTNTTVTLSGMVKNAAQKNAAGAIAKREAPGYKIANNIKVGM